MQYCWFSEFCGKKEEICKNCLDNEACTRYNQMVIQTNSANIPNIQYIRHVLEKPKDPTSPDWEVYKSLFNLNIEELVNLGKSIVIEGTNSGNGKTSFATNLLLNYLESQLGKSNAGYFISMPNILFEIREAISSGKVLPYENIFTRVRLLVLDDIGHKKYTDYEENWLLRLISLRQMKGLSTIYTMTTGKRDDSLLDKIGERLFSRIYVGSIHYYLAECDKRSWKV